MQQLDLFSTHENNKSLTDFEIKQKLNFIKNYPDFGFFDKNSKTNSTHIWADVIEKNLTNQKNKSKIYLFTQKLISLENKIKEI